MGGGHNAPILVRVNQLEYCSSIIAFLCIASGIIVENCIHQDIQNPGLP